jgi:deoxyribonuclease-4
MAVERATDLKCNAMQFFWRNPRSWARVPLSKEEVSLFKAVRKASALEIAIIHTPYLINLSSPDDALFEKSVELFKREFTAAVLLGVDFIVTHLGSHRGKGADYALGRIECAMRQVSELDAAHGKNCPIVLFENSAGGGNTFGSNIDEIGLALDTADSAGLSAGFCFDTCHGFAAGYPLESRADVKALVTLIDNKVGLKRLRLIHLNDSKGALDSRVDRHEHIGKGKIGLKGFRAFLGMKEFNRLPIILETPKETEMDDSKNIKIVKRIVEEQPNG